MIEQSNAVPGEHSKTKHSKNYYFLKKRAEDTDLLTTAKNMLSRGVKPGVCALLLRLPNDLVEELYKGSYNPRCRRPDAKTQRQQSAEAAAAFDAGASLESLCATYSQPLFTMIRMLQIAGVDSQEIARAMPPANHPLMAEYNKTIARGRKRNGRPISIN